MYHSFIFTCWLLHVSAVACHHQGANWILLSYVKYKRRGGISYNVWLRGLCAGLWWLVYSTIPEFVAWCVVLSLNL
jgi:hypothetical protein